MSILNNEKRIGNFTSSEIWKLTLFGKGGNLFGEKATTYIKEKNFERKLGLSIGTESNAKPLTWGKHLEFRVFDMLGAEYELTSQLTKVHPEFDCWAGSADCVKHGASRINTLPDIKCPFTRKSFCELLECNNGEDLKREFPEYYWQLVSNAVLNNCANAELIVYMPYQSELNDIRESTGGIDTLQRNLLWINSAEDEELPYLKDGGLFKNINIIPIEVPLSDIEFLTNRVKHASKLLIKWD